MQGMLTKGKRRDRVAKKKIETPMAPKALGPYSQGIVASGEMLFVSGQIPFTKEGEFVGEDITLQTKQCMENIGAILKEAGYLFSDVVKMSLFLKDLGDFEKVNEVYGAYFDEVPPARACVQVAKLPKDVSIEIEAIAVK